jgi:hypothetical protein
MHVHQPAWQFTATGAAKPQSDISIQVAQTSLDRWPMPQKIMSASADSLPSRDELTTVVRDQVLYLSLEQHVGICQVRKGPF